jgi:succinate dehydrogenase flavin-adding protein (antitoxin of CptAB toxin-antitoxin module)
MIDDLKQNKLKIRYNNKKIKIFEDRIISNELRDIIINILTLSRFSEEDYQKLDTNDKIYFDDILSKANLEPNHMLFKHKKYNDSEKKELINRYQILSGELLSGNNNYDLFLELKNVIIKLMHLDVLDKTIVNKLLFDLLYIF